MSYHNTTNEPSNQLPLFEAKAVRQEDKVLELFKSTNVNYTASKVRKALGIDCPLTSIRRAMSNLKNKGLLELTKDKAKGIYGRNEYYYTLPQKTK